jgi:hypothetical protein
MIAPLSRRLTHATLLLVLATSSAAAAADLEVSFADPLWTGDKVPDGQQCQKFGGKDPGSPVLVVANIPAGANALVLEVNDKTYTQMDNGGHGKFGYTITPGAGTVTVPSLPGHTSELPEGFFVVAEHQAPTWDKPGAYLPPCSGGRGNTYSITVKAMHKMGEELHELGKAEIVLGTF